MPTESSLVADSPAATTDAGSSPASVVDERVGLHGWSRSGVRWWATVMALLAIYGLVVGLMDPRAHLITDVGGKTATLEAMTQRGDWDPDLGYWFEDTDPEGELFPLDKTSLAPNGQWVNTTSLTMVLPARPLWEIGGARSVLVVPMLGAVLCALGAGALQRRWSPGTDGFASALVVGAATPAFVYAVDFWEHSLGLAAITWGMVAVIDVGRQRSPAWLALAGGLCFGLAATMRQEALVYGFVAGLVLLIEAVRARGVMVAGVRSLLFGAGAAAMVAAHAWLELSIYGGSLRTARSGGVIGAGGGNEFESRVRAAAATVLFPLNGDHAVSYVLGALLLVSLVWLTVVVTGLDRRSRRDPRLAIVYAALVWSLYAVALLRMGPRFVPGLVATTPLAVVGAVAGFRDRRWIPLVLGLGPLPLVLATAYTDGSIVQWGGRYQLATGLMLTVLAISSIDDGAVRHRRRLIAGAGAFGLFVTLFGVAWGIERTQRVADGWDVVASVTEPDDVVVWHDTAHAREAGAFSVGRRWLGAPTQAQQTRLVLALDENGIDHFYWIDRPSPDLPTFEGFAPGESLGELELFGDQITRFSRVADTHGN